MSICPDKIKEITGLINKEYDKIIKQVAKLNNKMKHINDQIVDKEIPLDFDDAVLCFEDENDIDEEQKELIKTTAELINEIIMNKEQNGFSEYLSDSIDENKIVISRSIKNLGLSLTEDAWNFLERIHDNRLLHILITILPFTSFEKRIREMAIALFENENFARYFCNL